MTYNFPALYFEATRLCNLQCPLCMTGSNDAHKVRDKRRSELSFDEIRELVLLPAKRLGVIAVGWSGGEFLLRKDATNGKVTISVGLNSIDERNEWTRDAKPDRTLEVLALCDELKIDRHVIVTISKDNTKTFADTVKYLTDRRISYNRSPYVARGSGCDMFHKLAFDRNDLEAHFHPELRSHVNGYVSYTPFFLSPELHAQVSGGAANGAVPQNPPIGCWVGTWLALNAEGDLSVCPVLLDQLKAGNVREKPLDELVASSQLFADVLDRGKLTGKCGDCRYQYTCGGCRAMAYY